MSCATKYFMSNKHNAWYLVCTSWYIPWYIRPGTNVWKW